MNEFNNIAFIDIEVNPRTNTPYDFAAVSKENHELRTKDKVEYSKFITKYKYLAGHNIINHDLKYIKVFIPEINTQVIDTLFLSALLFPKKPYHKLLKDDKFHVDEENNPFTDSVKCRDLFYDELNAFKNLDTDMKEIFAGLLMQTAEFNAFFQYILDNTASTEPQFLQLIKEGEYSQREIQLITKDKILAAFEYKVCQNANLLTIIENDPIPLAYALALIYLDDVLSKIPAWINIQFPRISRVMRDLVGTSCYNCQFCKNNFDVNLKLKEIFGFDEFRKYDGEPLQENAAKAAIDNKSLLAVFPTGGGKSITFQLPALMRGDHERALTVVISPLVSLMKDQVDNLSKKGINKAVAISSLLDSIERAQVIERVENGSVSMLYLSPESLRSASMERLLLSRNISRFVIDEAHCFSSWGQDFRVDYQYIAQFIKSLEEKKNLGYTIPVSCFTATAKKEVINDIRTYFKNNLGLDLELFTTSSTRTNLAYEAIYKETDDKYEILRELILANNCATIVYTARTATTKELAERLEQDGISASYFHGRLEKDVKIENQENFISGKIQVMVATSAFGMGVDKDNVELVVHYDISDSMENYMQEAGRAGRDENIKAKCYVIYNEEDLDKHFVLHNQTKLKSEDIQNVLKVIKNETKEKKVFRSSALEIGKLAGFSLEEAEGYVKTAIAAIEDAGYIQRGKNYPQIYADSLHVANMIDAEKIISNSSKFTEKQKESAKRILTYLFSRKNTRGSSSDLRVDVMSENLAIERVEVIQLLNMLRYEKILANEKDLTAHINPDYKEKTLQQNLGDFIKLENFLLDRFTEKNIKLNLKDINGKAINEGLAKCSIQKIKALLTFWEVKEYIRRPSKVWSDNIVFDFINTNSDTLRKETSKYHIIAKEILAYIYLRAGESSRQESKTLVSFSILELYDRINNGMLVDNVETKDIENALLYLTRLRLVTIDGNFLVLYSPIEIKSLMESNRTRYKASDYSKLEEFYKQKVQKIHMVGKFIELLLKDTKSALEYMQYYFSDDTKEFLKRYFKGNEKDIEKSITSKKYKELFSDLSPKQLEIIDDKESKNIAVIAGPGSGKTKVLVHKLASLISLEDVRPEQLLMLTFSRAAATEFKERLVALVGKRGYFIEIKTFHSYCFDLIGKIGNLEDSDTIIKNAINYIVTDEAEEQRITKSVLVIDEAQDMSESEFALIKALMAKNENIRVIAVGDDDQNIYEFRGASNKNLEAFIVENSANKYTLLDNYRSSKNIVYFANIIAQKIPNRLKDSDIQPVTNVNGEVCLIQHESSSFEEAIVNKIKDTSRRQKGNIAVLTTRNEEAYSIAYLLRKEGIPAKLVQSLGSFSVYSCIEIRTFLKFISKKSTTSIPEEVWLEALEELKKKYASSRNLDLFLGLLQKFSNCHNSLYISDLENFLKESKIEDAYLADSHEVFISTIHKAKGREFDSVYLMLKDVDISKAEDIRKLYVGVTRAKNSLYVHHNISFFNSLEFSKEYIQQSIDKTIYPPPDKIMCDIGFKDMVLNFFKHDKKKEFFMGLEAGCKFAADDTAISFTNNTQVFYSKGFKEKLNNLITRGYYPEYAELNFIVAWNTKEDNKEYAIPISTLYLSKK